MSRGGGGGVLRSAVYACTVPASATVDRLLLEVVASLSGIAVEFTTTEQRTAGDEEESSARHASAVGTITDAFAGQTHHIALLGVPGIARHWWNGGAAESSSASSSETQAAASWIDSTDQSLLALLRSPDFGKC